MQAYYDAGHDRDACRERFGFQLAAWYKAIRRGRLRAATVPTRYDWSAVQQYYDAGHSVRDCCQRFGFTLMAWTKAVRRGSVRPRPRSWTVEEVLARSRYRGSIKRRLIQAGILRNVCDECGLDSWRGKPLAIQIDHRNGVRDDHRLENLRMLCPNCHIQTETFAGRNPRRRKSTIEQSRLMQR
ncbi:MAG TPA: HNH endonuclease signature motif containing protein [Candidatus Sulfotelmatobacter sp.]|nr:HNH endonuclease signature motif containing protein [Candidatus Sulfotelmatobacter sp.]